MFRPMRRSKQQLSEKEVHQLLRRGQEGVLAVAGDDGYPYAVPLNYDYDGNRLIFHCAVQGHKLDALRRCQKASFCVIDAKEVRPADFTTAYRSVIVFGHVQELTGLEKLDALMHLGERFSAGFDVASEVQRYHDRTTVLALMIEHATGKAHLSMIQGTE